MSYIPIPIDEIPEDAFRWLMPAEESEEFGGYELGKIGKEVIQDVTDRIIAALEKGVTPWIKPWDDRVGPASIETPRNIYSKRTYRGVNVVLLWSEAMKHGYATGNWITYKQARDAGGYVRRGEHGSTAIFWKILKQETEKTDPTTGETTTDKQSFPMARTYTVFNIEQVEDLPEKILQDISPPINEEERNENLDKFANAVDITTRHSAGKAFYSPSDDFISVPPIGAFRSKESYYSTLFHELIHATGHKNRLNRDFSGRFGSGTYAFEELIAELGAAFLCGHLVIPGELQHAEYLGHWIEVMRTDKYAIFTASREAQKAVDWLLEKSGIDDEMEDEEASGEVENPRTGEVEVQ